MSAGTPEGWRRLHPLSPVVRGGRATIAIFILLIPIAFGGDTLGHATPQFAVIAVIVLAGVVSWLVTRWRIDDDDLRIETGLLRHEPRRDQNGAQQKNHFSLHASFHNGVLPGHCPIFVLD